MIEINGLLYGLESEVKEFQEKWDKGEKDWSIEQYKHVLKKYREMYGGLHGCRKCTHNKKKH